MFKPVIWGKKTSDVMAQTAEGNYRMFNAC